MSDVGNITPAAFTSQDIFFNLQLRLGPHGRTGPFLKPVLISEMNPWQASMLATTLEWLPLQAGHSTDNARIWICTNHLICTGLWNNCCLIICSHNIKKWMDLMNKPPMLILLLHKYLFESIIITMFQLQAQVVQLCQSNVLQNSVSCILWRHQIS